MLEAKSTSQFLRFQNVRPAPPGNILYHWFFMMLSILSGNENYLYCFYLFERESVNCLLLQFLFTHFKEGRVSFTMWIILFYFIYRGV